MRAADLLAPLLAPLLLAACAAVPHDAAPRPDAELQREIERLVGPFRGTVGVHVQHLGDGRTAGVRADETFPTASMVKVPILLGVFERLEKGELEYRKALKYEVARKYPGEDLLARFEDGAPIPLAELCALMCAFSDNTASLWCQELAGGGATINAWLDAHGFRATRVNSRTEGRKDAQQEFGWGQTTPREMAGLLVAIHERRAVSPAADEEMERLLSRSYWSGEALSAIPPHVHAMSKQGAVNRSRSEVLLVDAPSGPWVLCVITKDQEDESWEHGNAGFQLLRDVTAAVWRHFEPEKPYSPAPGARRYW
jgi:beta-lactamase class A